jgi:hypothetical protein
MRELLERLAAGAPDVGVTYHIGDAFNGETRLEVRGDGGFELSSTVTAGRQALDWDGELAAERVTGLVGVLIDAEVWEARPFRKAGDDDPLATITVAGPAGSHGVGVPASQTHAVAPFAASQAAFLELARELSEGAVLEVGR